MKLSILMCGVPSRLASGAPSTLVSLFFQAADNPEVEVLYLVDNKRRTIGAKRTALLQVARGDFVTWVDDDDEVSPHFVKTLLDEIDGRHDVVTFPIRVTLNGADEGIVSPSIFHREQEEFRPGVVTRRMPVYNSCWRRSLVADIPFPETNIGEDFGWAALAVKRVTTEKRIDSVLYHYRFSRAVTEAVPRE